MGLQVRPPPSDQVPIDLSQYIADMGTLSALEPPARTRPHVVPQPQAAQPTQPPVGPDKPKAALVGPPPAPTQVVAAPVLVQGAAVPVSPPQPVSLDAFPVVGTCAVAECGKRVHQTPHGTVCHGGHGGAAVQPLEPEQPLPAAAAQAPAQVQLPVVASPPAPVGVAFPVGPATHVAPPQQPPLAVSDMPTVQPAAAQIVPPSAAAPSLSFAQARFIGRVPAMLEEFSLSLSEAQEALGCLKST